jgi:hypothetical protein
MRFILLAVALTAGAAPALKSRKLTPAEVEEVAGQIHVQPEQIDDTQAFEIESAGKVTRFVALPNPQASSEYYLVRDGKAVAHASSYNTISYAFNIGIEAVSFEDVTGDGLWDVEVVEHHAGAGGARADGSRGELDYGAPVLLVQHPDGSFTDETARLNWSCAKGKKQPNSPTLKDIRKAAGCVSALKSTDKDVR